MSGPGSDSSTPPGAYSSAGGAEMTWAAASMSDERVQAGALDDLETEGDRYRLESIIGRGGMGEVQLCADDRTGRHVAMKVVRGGHGDAQRLRSRFLREARVQAQLEHPSIVPVYDLGKLPDGEMYFTMKRVRGRPLNEIIASIAEGNTDPAFSRRRLLSAFAQVCLAIDFAHKRGVLHRDLKPANLMLGEYGEVYVLDWGLAKIGDADETGNGIIAPTEHPTDIEATADGAIMGTPGYIAPEQLEGTSIPASDVYSLGAILFELLTCERLNVGDSPHELFVATLWGTSDLPSERRPDLELPPELDEVCRRATAVTLEERFESARALYEAIERHLDGDRNVSLRIEYANKAAVDAARLTDQAIQGDDPARTPALRAIARTLVLDPGHRGALGMLGRLLSSPPKELPVAAAEAVQRSELEQVRLEARHGAVGFVSWVLYLPLILWLGLLDSTSLVVSTALILGAAWTSYRVSLPTTPPRFRWVAIIVGTLALCSLYRLFGAFIFLPTIIVGHVVAYGTSPDLKMRWAAAAAGTIALCATAAADYWGLVAAQTISQNGALTVLPGLTSLPPGVTQLVLLASSVALVITPVVIIGRSRDQLTSAQRKIEVQAWQFRQMVSDAEDDDGVA